jgi:hypothetical protein
MKITLSKALKLKNQLVRDMTAHMKNVTEHNSYRSENPPNFHVTNELVEVNKLRNKLVAVKAAISVANTGIYEKIYELAELKGYIQSLRGVNTKQGKESQSGYLREPKDIEYLVTYSDKAIADLIGQSEKMIESLQDEVDTYNHTTLVEIAE